MGWVGEIKYGLITAVRSAFNLEADVRPHTIEECAAYKYIHTFLFQLAVLSFFLFQKQ